MAKGPTVSTTFNAKDKISKPMQKMKKNMKTFALAGGAAIAAASVATVKAVNNFANAGDEIAKSARKVGVSVEALQELRFAADRSGVSAETLQTSLQKLNKNVGDLRAGTGALKTILDKTNPAMAEQLKNAESNEEAFNILVKALSETENEMDRAALAQAAFGRAGQDLLILTENGAEGIEQLREEAREYGNVISTEAAAASEMYVDSLTNMKNSMLAVRNRALIPLMEKLQPLIQLVADYVAANQELINQRIENVFNGIRKSVEVIVRLWDNGLIPALLAGATAWMAITKAIAAYKAAVVLAKAAQLAFNASMATNPIGLIIVGVSALIAIIVLLVQNWDLVKKAVIGFVKGAWAAIKWFVTSVWENFSNLLDNPFFTAAATIIAPWLTIPALILKHWEPIMEFFKMLGEKITAGAQAIGGFFKGVAGTVGGALDRGADAVGGLIGRNDAQLAGAGVSNSSELSVNFNNAPAGTEFRQRGTAPGITINTGRRGRL